MIEYEHKIQFCFFNAKLNLFVFLIFTWTDHKETSQGKIKMSRNLRLSSQSIYFKISTVPA